MQYLVLLYGDESLSPQPGTPEWDADMAGYMAFGELADKAIVSGDALYLTEHASAPIRHDGGNVSVTNGPFAETTEALGGYYVLDAPTPRRRHRAGPPHPRRRPTGAGEIRPLVMHFDRSDGRPARPRARPASSRRSTAPRRTADVARHRPRGSAMAAGPRRLRRGRPATPCYGGGAVQPAATATTVAGARRRAARHRRPVLRDDRGGRRLLPVLRGTPDGGGRGGAARSRSTRAAPSSSRPIMELTMAEPRRRRATLVDEVFRAEAGRALATIARLVGDLGVAEDAVQEAFIAALRRWPATGRARPARRVDHHDGPQPGPRRAAPGDPPARPRGDGGAGRPLEATPPILHPVVDDQLQLMFTCCHPALATEARVTLTLRLVVRPARCPRSPGRCSRARRRWPSGSSGPRRKIRSAGHPPAGAAAGAARRAAAVGPRVRLPHLHRGLRGHRRRRPRPPRAVRRGASAWPGCSSTLLPGEPGAEALLALLLLQDSRRAGPARRRPATSCSSPTRTAPPWDRDRIDEGLAWLERASGHPAMTRRRGRLPPPGGHRRRARPRRRRGRPPTGPPSSATTTSSPPSPARRSCSSTGPWRCPSPTAPRWPSRCSTRSPRTRSSRRRTCSTQHAPTSAGGWARSTRRRRSTAALELAGTEPERALLRRRLDELSTP